MVKKVQGVGGARATAGVSEIKHDQQTNNATNVNMTPKSDKYIETESYLNSRAKICAKSPALNKAFKSVEYTIAQDGSVKFNFKKEVNVEQFKKAFGFGDGNFRSYLKKRHDDGVKNGTVHAYYTNGAQTEHEQRTNYNMEGNGAKISYTDGYSETKGPRGGWINRSKLVDKPDYTNMSLGPQDNEKLFIFGKSFFNYKD